MYGSPCLAQQGDAVLVGGALLAVGGTGDGSVVLLDGLRVRAATLHRGQRGEDGGVVRLGAVGVVRQGLALGGLGPAAQAVLEPLLGVSTGDGALGALERARLEVLAVVAVLPSEK